jgi:3-hydroxyacyl-CoA dehydrogenase/enoyl-CoA hydratase/3-hydroxybutyryl-CoA epimerase
MDHIRKQTIEDLKAEGKEIPNHPAYKISEIMLSHKRPGKAAGGGFYEYPQSGKKHLWPELTNIFPQKEPMPLQDMIDRMMYIQAIETVRCYEEKVVLTVADANIGSIFGWGFAPFKGGTLQFINDAGLDNFIKKAEELNAKYGDRFQVPQLLYDMQKSGNKEFK